MMSNYLPKGLVFGLMLGVVPVQCGTSTSFILDRVDQIVARLMACKTTADAAKIVQDVRNDYEFNHFNNKPYEVRYNECLQVALAKMRPEERTVEGILKQVMHAQRAVFRIERITLFAEGIHEDFSRDYWRVVRDENDNLKKNAEFIEKANLREEGVYQTARARTPVNFHQKLAIEAALKALRHHNS